MYIYIVHNNFVDNCPNMKDTEITYRRLVEKYMVLKTKQRSIIQC